MRFIALLFGLQAIYWWIGRRSSQKVSTQEDYYLAGKNIRFFPLMMSFIGAQVGGGLVIGAADEAYRFGWTVLLYPLGNALGLIVLGLGMGRRLSQLQVSTIAEILEVVYGSPWLRKAASFLSVISLYMIFIGQIVASRKFLTAMGMSDPFLFVLFWASVILYTVRGGLKAVIATDQAQAIFFSAMLMFSFGYVTWEGNLPSGVESFAIGASKMSGWLLMPLMFMIIEQDMGQRCFAGETPRTVSRACFWAGVFSMFICSVPVFLGILAKTNGLAIPNGASVLMVAITQLTNPLIASLIGCAVIAAIISTAASLINAISSNLAIDFFRERKSLTMMKIISGLFSVFAIYFAFFFNNVVDILIQSYELSVSCLFVPIIIALFRKKCSLLSGALSMLFGACSFFLFKVLPPPIPTEIASVLISSLGFYCGYLLEVAGQRTRFSEK